MSEIKKMYCPSCGGPISFESGREDTFCSHCGSQLYFKDDHLEVKLKHEERKMEHEEKMSDIDYKKFLEKQMLKKLSWLSLLGLLVFLLCFLWFCFY